MGSSSEISKELIYEEIAVERNLEVAPTLHENLPEEESHIPLEEREGARRGKEGQGRELPSQRRSGLTWSASRRGTQPLSSQAYSTNS